MRRDVGNKKLGGSGTHWGEGMGEQIRIKAGSGVKVSETCSYMVPAVNLRGWSCSSQEPSKR